MLNYFMINKRKGRRLLILKLILKIQNVRSNMVANTLKIDYLPYCLHYFEIYPLIKEAGIIKIITKIYFFYLEN